MLEKDVVLNLPVFRGSIVLKLFLIFCKTAFETRKSYFPCVEKNNQKLCDRHPGLSNSVKLFRPERMYRRISAQPGGGDQIYRDSRYCRGEREEQLRQDGPQEDALDAQGAETEGGGEQAVQTEYIN